MGTEIASPYEWNHEGELPFYLLEYPIHQGMLRWVSDLNRLYRSTPALYLRDVEPDGFQWVEANDASRSVLVFLRSAEGHPPVLVVCNFTPEVWRDYRIGVAAEGTWRTLLSSDAGEYGGSGMATADVYTRPEESHGLPTSLVLDVPPMSATFLQPAG
jgi:1,4-alpha-glucan branching enzyme